MTAALLKSAAPARSDISFQICMLFVERIVVRNSLPSRPVIRRHLIMLTHTKGSVLCALPDIGPTLARIAGVARACVVGIRRDSTAQQQHVPGSKPRVVSAATRLLASDIATRSTPSSITWLVAGRADGEATEESQSAPAYRGMTVQKKGFLEKDKSKKRKKDKSS